MNDVTIDFTMISFISFHCKEIKIKILILLTTIFTVLLFLNKEIDFFINDVTVVRDT